MFFTSAKVAKQARICGTLRYMCREGEPFNSIGFALCFMCAYVCAHVIEKGICVHPLLTYTSPQWTGSSIVLGAEEVRGKLIDENLELEEDTQDHH